MTEVQRVMTYDERQAVIVLRKAILRKPWIANELLRDMPREVATTALLSVRDNLEQMQQVARAFSEAAAVLAKQQQAEKESQVATPPMG